MSIALTEIRRSPLRFGLLTAAVGLLLALVLFLATVGGALLSRITGALERQSAPVLVFAVEARRNVQASLIAPGVAERVAAVPGVAAVAPWVTRGFTLRTGAGLRDGTLIGYEPGGPGAPTDIVEGRLPRMNGEAVLSALDAEAGFEVGSTVRVLPGGSPLEIVGLAEGASFAVQPTLFTPYEGFTAIARRAFPDAGPVLPSVLAVAPAPGEDPVALARRITEAVPGVEALDRQTAVASVPGTDAIRSSLGLLLGLAFVVVVVVIGFFFLIFAVQKADVFTLLLAMGTPARSLVGGLALQVVLVVGVGSLLATGLLAALATTGDRAFPISVDPGLALGTGATAVALSLLAALGAVRRIVRIDPAAAVRGGGGELA
ncbi:MAG: hypothetical protein KatS3mg013_0296 [Actinomycetota bacterium]|jgi:putative ABC transport system permease protein|nr:MAG: hypothetical protein KatS3mg013_0296 [Actinomycetota bacterium]